VDVGSIAGTTVGTALALVFTENVSIFLTLMLVTAFVVALTFTVSRALAADENETATANKARPLGLWSALSAAWLLGVTSWVFSAPGWFFTASLLLPFGWFALALVWLGWLVFLGFSIRRRLTGRDVVRLVAAPLLGVAALGIGASDAAFDLRYRISEPGMNEVAEDVTTGARRAAGIDRIGTWPVDSVERFNGGMRFLVEGTGFLDAVGFAYSPDRRPPNLTGSDSYEHYRGPWWIWTQRWD